MGMQTRVILESFIRVIRVFYKRTTKKDKEERAVHNEIIYSLGESTNKKNNTITTEEAAINTVATSLRNMAAQYLHALYSHIIEQNSNSKLD